MENAVLVFPLSFELKVIMALGDIEDCRAILLSIYHGLEVPCGETTHRLSPEGRYVSFSTMVTLANRAKMDALYAALKNEPSVRFAV